jgi:hypothetical protein
MAVAEGWANVHDRSSYLCCEGWRKAITYRNEKILKLAKG